MPVLYDTGKRGVLGRVLRCRRSLLVADFFACLAAGFCSSLVVVVVGFAFFYMRGRRVCAVGKKNVRRIDDCYCGDYSAAKL